MNNTIRIRKITRFSGDLSESLEFTDGVNAIVGKPNAGKTIWLTMIDFLLGDTGGIEEALGIEDSSGQFLYEKYGSIEGEFICGTEELIIRRNWNQDGMKTKVIVNNVTMSTQEFSQFILSKLEIPVVHFPKGNPYAERSWPVLSWKMLMRHMYRQERFWSDLADKQPEIEQHAVISQFLNLADKFFPQKLGKLVDKRKELIRLEAERDQFEKLLDKIASELSSFDNKITFATKETIAEKIQELELKLTVLLELRENTLAETALKIEDYDQETMLQLSRERMSLVQDIENLETELKNSNKRIEEFHNLQFSITEELIKLERAVLSGIALSDLKITHCPACDQELINTTKTEIDECFLCHRKIDNQFESNRIDFEIAQLNSEKEELKELLNKLHEQLNIIENNKSQLIEKLFLIDKQIEPLKLDYSNLVNEKLSIIDSERGRILEQITTFRKIETNVEYKNLLNTKIDLINFEISAYENDVEIQDNDLNLEQKCSDLEDGIMLYLNSISSGKQKRWESGRVKFKINERTFQFLINNTKWSSIGATSKAYFLFAYHFGLLNLTSQKDYNYPGLLIIDFPPQLANIDLYDKENYLIEPFVKLCTKRENMQVIIAGREFENLDNINKLELTTKWK